VATGNGGNRSLRAPRNEQYSLSSAHVAETSLTPTNLHLACLPTPVRAGTAPLSRSRVRSGTNQFSRDGLRQPPSTAGRPFRSCRSRYQVHALLARSRRRAAGIADNGAMRRTSLAGAVYRQVRHGGDLEVTLLFDWIRAVHLVGAWRSGMVDNARPAANFADQRLSLMPELVPDTRILADEPTFDAARVAVGRMGVVYAMIWRWCLNLAWSKSNLEYRWDDIRAQLGTRASTGAPTSIFDAALSDLESGWFRSELLRRHRQFSAGVDQGDAYASLPLTWAARAMIPPPASPAQNRLYQEMLRRTWAPGPGCRLARHGAMKLASLETSW